jgi:hypothetical protein
VNTVAQGEHQAKNQGGLDRAFARISPRLLDRIEQGLILMLWVFLLRRVLVSVFGTADLAVIAHAPLKWDTAWLLLLSETAVMVFVMIRRPTQAVSLNLGDWLLAVTATAAPLLVQPAGGTLTILVDAGVALVLLGNVGQALASWRCAALSALPRPIAG